MIPLIQGARKDNFGKDVESGNGQFWFGEVLDWQWRFVLIFEVAWKIKKGEISENKIV